MRLHLEDAEIDWDLLCNLGLPLTTERQVGVPPRREDLILQTRLAALQLERGDVGQQDVERKRDGLRALLLALSSHFPQLYRRHLAVSEPVRRLAEAPIDGRILKLQRIARENLARYL
jgi:hypothetical protein